MQDIFNWQQRLGPLLAPPAALASLSRRVRASLYAMGLLPSWRPPVPSVCVGGADPAARGKVMLTAWLMGWARARGIVPAAVVSTGEAAPQPGPLSVTLATDVRQCGTEAALLIRYRPGETVLADEDPVRAAKSAVKNVSPGLLVLQGHFSSLACRRDLDIALLTPHDLDRGWNRVFPAGTWRESARALARASAFVLGIWPDELSQRRALAERRLAGFGKPVFTLHPSIWRLRASTGETAADLGGEPYLLVAAQSNQDVAARAAQAFLGMPPRLRVTFPDSHRFTRQDQEQIAAETGRIRVQHALATPDAALRLGALPGVRLWTYDPDVVLGPCLLSGREFTPWWEESFAALSAER
jgi:tetraacyldisaccharide 4'-kinase